MIQGNRGDRQAGADRRACTTTCTRPTTGTCRWAAPGSCSTTCATARPPTASTLTIDLGARPDGTYDHRGVFIPPGVAHGFAALTDMIDHLSRRRLLQPGRRARRRVGRSRDRGRLGRDRPDALGPRPAEPRARRHRPSRCDPLGPAHVSSRRILVTGGAGFIGSNYVRHVLAHTDDEVTVYDALTYAGNLSTLRDVDDDPRYQFVKGNICDPEHARGRDARPRRRRALRGREPRRPLDRRAPTTSSTRTASAPTS